MIAGEREVKDRRGRQPLPVEGMDPAPAQSFGDLGFVVARHDGCCSGSFSWSTQIGEGMIWGAIVPIRARRQVTLTYGSRLVVDMHYAHTTGQWESKPHPVWWWGWYSSKQAVGADCVCVGFFPFFLGGGNATTTIGQHIMVRAWRNTSSI